MAQGALTPGPPLQDLAANGDRRVVAHRLRDRPSRICVLLVAIEAVVVLAVIHMGSHSILSNDGREYERYATNLVNHFEFSSAAVPPFSPSVFRTPGYPLFLALFQWIAPGSLVLVRIGQFILLAVTALLVYRVALFVAAPRAALVSAVLCATFLPLVWLAAYHLTEVLATFLTVAVVLLIFKAMGRGQSPPRTRFGACSMVGVATGLLAMVRPEAGLAVVPIAIGLFAAGRPAAARERLLRVGVVLVAFALVITPWTIRNAVVAHRFIPFGTASGQSLYVSAQQYAGRISYGLPPAVDRQLYGPHGDFAQITERDSSASWPLGGSKAELASNAAIQAAAGRAFQRLSVGRILRDVPTRVAHLWGTGDFPPAGRSFTTLAHGLAVGQYALILALAALGLVISAASLRTRLWPLLVFPLYTTVAHLVFHAEARYTIPDRPFLFVFAGLGFVWLAAFVGRRLRLTS